MWPPSRIRGLCPLIMAGTVVSGVPPRATRQPMTAQADEKKRRAALAALELVGSGATIGVGTGSTVSFFIEALAACPERVRRAVSSSEGTSARLRAAGIALVDLNDLTEL